MIFLKVTESMLEVGFKPRSVVTSTPLTNFVEDGYNAKYIIDSAKICLKIGKELEK